MISITSALGFEIRQPDLNKCLSDCSASSTLCSGLNALTLQTPFSTVKRINALQPVLVSSLFEYFLYKNLHLV